jgi:protein gp37
MDNMLRLGATIDIAQADIVTQRERWPLPNVIICASVEDQRSANELVPLLLQIPARWRGVSVEPMLSPVRLDDIVVNDNGCEWHANALECDVDPEDDADWNGATLDIVICGAETGPGKRNFKDEWALDLRDQCKIAGVPYFFKKDGSGNGSLCGVEYHEWI